MSASPPSFAWDLVKLVADGSKCDTYDTPTEETYDLALPEGESLGIDGLVAVRFDVVGGPATPTTLYFRGIVSDPGRRGFRVVFLQSVFQSDPDMDVVETHASWSRIVERTRASEEVA